MISAQTQINRLKKLGCETERGYTAYFVYHPVVNSPIRKCVMAINTKDLKALADELEKEKNA